MATHVELHSITMQRAQSMAMGRGLLFEPVRLILL